jgi:delta(3,5)-delta(2,4)-dienoyl-CoA isomerase
MGSTSEKPSYSHDYFTVSFPKQYVAHVEINRPDKLNAFIEVYVTACLGFRELSWG